MRPTSRQRLALFFAPLRTRQAILARAELGISDPGDAGLSDQLARELIADMRPDGSVRGGAVATIWRAHELMDLGQTRGDVALARLVMWMLDRQDAPGAYGEGCDRGRHTQRICAHYIGGFFSPAPPTERLAPITLPSGKAFRAEAAARFAISCLALRAVLRAGVVERPAVIRHLDSLRLLAEGWTDWNGFFAPDVIIAGLHALALGGAPYRPTVERVVDLVAEHQQVDGQWNGADLFQALEALLATGLPAARRSVRHAVPALESRLRPDGSFGATAQQERALIGVRALRCAEGR